jgi:hypothetical protein
VLDFPVRLKEISLTFPQGGSRSIFGVMHRGDTAMTNGIPDQLTDYKLLKIHGPSADCNHPGKQPVGSATEGPFYRVNDPELVRHINNGGNVGIPLFSSLVVFDVDHDQFGELLDFKLPPTFTVRTGSGGEHRYFHSPNWPDDRQIRVNGTDLGSVRSDGWQVVIPPSVHPETGEQYRIKVDRQISSVGSYEIASVLESITDHETSQHSGGGGDPASGGGCVGGSSVPSIPEEYPNRPAQWETLRSWLSANGFLEELNYSSGDRSGREFAIAKCLAEGGFSETAISDVLSRLPHDSKWHERGDRYKTRTVRKAILAAVNDEFVEFSKTGDMGAGASESRKTEESGDGRTLRGGENNMPEFNDKLAVPILEGSEDGDSFKKAVLVEGNDNGDTFEYVALKKGRVQEVNTTDGDTVLAESVNDSVSLGSPEYLDELIDGLEALREELE